MNTPKVIGKVGKFNIGFRPERLTSHAGTVLLHDFAQRLGVEGVLDEELGVKTRERGYSEGQAISSLVYNVILRGEHLSDLEVLRGDRGTQELLAAEAILAPTTAGEFLRKFDLGDVQDLQRVQGRLATCPPAEDGGDGFAAGAGAVASPGPAPPTGDHVHD